MAPCIPTTRPTFTATRLAVAVALLALTSSAYLVFLAPPATAAPTASSIGIGAGCGPLQMI